MSRLPTNSLDRALLLLQFIAKTPGGMTNLEVSRRFGIARSTCTYILSRLEKEGYVARDKNSGKYRIGLKNLVLGRNALREAGFRAVSEPTLYRIAADTGLAANLAVLEGNRAILLDRVEGPAFVKAALEESGEHTGAARTHRTSKADYLDREHRDIGSELPVCTTALGKVLLAHLPEAEFATFVEHASPGADIEFNQLLSDLRRVRELGYCMMSFEPHNESCALAAPIFDAGDVVRAAVAVSCRRHLPVWRDERMLSELVKDAAWEISCRLHYPKILSEPRGESGDTVTKRANGEVRTVRRPS
jgi:DNA-binding IclR family transcriptional regulator